MPLFLRREVDYTRWYNFRQSPSALVTNLGFKIIQLFKLQKRNPLYKYRSGRKVVIAVCCDCWRGPPFGFFNIVQRILTTVVLLFETDDLHCNYNKWLREVFRFYLFSKNPFVLIVVINVCLCQCCATSN